VVALYNENDPAAAHVLRHMIKEGVIAYGHVNEKSIKDLTPDDVKDYCQVHLFAGGGFWSVAARLAGWPDDEPLWSASFPCQPFSAAGKGGGINDPRHLWPDGLRLIRAARPPVIMGEQVAGKAGYGWFDGISADLARENYASRSVDFPACSVNAPHQRNRQYWVAVNELVDTARVGWREGITEPVVRGGRSAVTSTDAPELDLLGHRIVAGLEGQRRNVDEVRRPDQGRSIAASDGGLYADTERARLFPASQSGIYSGEESARSRNVEFERHDASHSSILPDANVAFVQGQSPTGEQPVNQPDAGLYAGNYWSDFEWIDCHDGKTRRTKPGLRFLVNGLPGRVDLWRIGGNAIVPQAAKEVIASFIDAYGLPSTWGR
jgi:DNA (cytosine-5)-methyltransferase 1